MTRFTSAVALCLLLQFAITPVSAATATIATASNFKMAMQELVALFEASSEHRFRQVNASSGVLYNQIIHGAPFDLYLAANSNYPTLLAERGQGIAASQFTYAQGKLVLAFTNRSLATASLSNGQGDKAAFQQLLTDTLAAGEKIAIAHPDIAPYGIAGQQTLAHLELWQASQGQLVRGNNVSQSLQFVATGNSALGFVALSQLLALPTGLALDYWRVPEHWYQPIRQQAILLQSGQQNPAALAFMDYLKSPAAQTIIQRSGYSTVASSSRP